MEEGRNFKKLYTILAIFLAITAVSFAIYKALQDNKSPSQDAEVFVVEPPVVGSEACYKAITVVAPPTYGACDAESCVQVECDNPHDCPENECENDDACRDTPPAEKYKTCENESCVEKVCSDQNNCPEDSCTSSTECVREENPPVCNEILATPTKGTADLKVRFSVDATGDNLELFQFDFGDGESMDSPNDTVYHTYKEGGDFEASVKIVNNNGEKTDRDDCKVTVKVEASTYFTCQDQACVEVEGDGVSTCSEDLQCQQATTHLECRSTSCVAVAGAGSNMCATNTDCGEQPVKEIPVTGTNTTLIIGGLASFALILLGVLVL